jgi:hypothetical protein
LFAAVLTSFLIDSLQNLQPDPAQQAVYYHQQSVAMLAQISQQLAAIAPHVYIPSTPPAPYPAFYPSKSDTRVNAYWLIGLVCSLSAALFATLVQQWVRSYMKVFRQYDHPLKRARFRQFFFEGARPIRTMAIAVPSLIRFSLALFFIGLCDYLLNLNRIVAIITIVPICCCGLFFLYGMLKPHFKLQSPHQTLFSWPIFFLFFLKQKFWRHKRFNRNLSEMLTSKAMETCQEQVVTEETDERKDRDVRAIQWLIDGSAVNDVKMEPLVLAIPGSFNTEWGRDVWRQVSLQARDTFEPPTVTSPAGAQASSIPHPSYPLEAADDAISRCVRYLFQTCNNHSHFENEEARRRRMRVCVEAVAPLVCCFGFPLSSFGEVGKLVSEIGHIEKVNQSPTTISDPSFIVRWTCLSLVAIQRILSGPQLSVYAYNAMDGLARSQSEYGPSDKTGLWGAQRIEECLKTAWERVEGIRRVFEPWTQKRTRVQVEEILRKHEQQISELERIKVEADGMEDVDWRISFYQEAMDDATYRLTRQLPGVSFDEPRGNESLLLSDAFSTPATRSDAATPQLIFPGQQVQALARLGMKLREVLDGQVAEGYEKVLESLKSVDQVPLSLRRPDGLMRRQLWRLQDLRNGGGLGFTVELFFLSLKQLPLHESNSVFYVGTFKIITSGWEKSTKSPDKSTKWLGTQHILLNILSDLIIRDRGNFSNFAYPQPITDMLLEMVGKMLRRYAGPDEDIRGAVREIEKVDTRTCMDNGLRCRALTAIPQSRSYHQNHVVANSVS